MLLNQGQVDTENFIILKKNAASRVRTTSKCYKPQQNQTHKQHSLESQKKTQT